MPVAAKSNQIRRFPYGAVGVKLCGEVVPLFFSADMQLTEKHENGILRCFAKNETAELGKECTESAPMSSENGPGRGDAQSKS